MSAVRVRPKGDPANFTPDDIGNALEDGRFPFQSVVWNQEDYVFVVNASREGKQEMMCYLDFRLNSNSPSMAIVFPVLRPCVPLWPVECNTNSSTCTRAQQSLRIVLATWTCTSKVS